MTDTSDKSVTLTVEGPEERATLTVPRALLDLLGTDEEEPADVVANVALLSCTRRIFEAVRFSEGAVDEELQAIETDTLALFEEQFGTSFEGIVGYDESEDHRH